MENSYSNTVRSWSPSLWSLNNDANFLSGSIAYPGGSGAGSVSGFTQTGNGVDMGIEYDLRNKDAVQFDAVQTADRVDITSTNVRNGIAGANGISVFFRANGFQSLGVSAEIGIYNPAIGEVLAPFDTGSASVDLGEWHNYAVTYDLTTLQLGVYVDQILLGTVDLNTFGGTKFGGQVVAPGAFAAVVTAATNDAISVGERQAETVSGRTTFRWSGARARHRDAGPRRRGHAAAPPAQSMTPALTPALF